MLNRNTFRWQRDGRPPMIKRYKRHRMSRYREWLHLSQCQKQINKCATMSSIIVVLTSYLRIESELLLRRCGVALVVARRPFSFISIVDSYSHTFSLKIPHDADTLSKSEPHRVQLYNAEQFYQITLRQSVLAERCKWKGFSLDRIQLSCLRENTIHLDGAMATATSVVK